MGFLGEMFNALIGRSNGPKVDFAGLNPDDIEGYHRVDEEIDQAEREGGDAARSAVWARYGIKNEDHWETVKYSFYQKHGQSSEFVLAKVRAQINEQLASFRQHYPFPDELLAPIEGVGLDRYALVEAHLGRAVSPAARQQILTSYGLDEARYERIRSGWSSRMATPDPMISTTLGGFAHTYRSVADGWLSRNAN